MNTSSQNPPIGMFTLVNFVFRSSLTPIGIAVVLISSATWCFWQYTNLPSVYRLLPAFGFSLLFWFVVFIASMVAAIGDSIALFALNKLLGDTFVGSLLGKALYVTLSVCSFTLVALFVSFGDHPITRALEP